MVRTGDVLILFGREPRPGAVKERLVPPLTEDQAAGLYEAFLRDIAARQRSAGVEVRLLVAPPFDEAAVRRLVPGSIAVGAQNGETLAERLDDAFSRAFGAGAQRVVVRNTDSPLLPAAREEDAFARLDGGADVVLGPDRGGGFYLVGLRRPLPDLFQVSEPSLPTNFRLALDRARVLVDRVEVLAPEDDVDTPSDLAKLTQRIDGDPGLGAYAPFTAAFLRKKTK